MPTRARFAVDKGTIPAVCAKARPNLEVGRHGAGQQGPRELCNGPPAAVMPDAPRRWPPDQRPSWVGRTSSGHRDMNGHSSAVPLRGRCRQGLLLLSLRQPGLSLQDWRRTVRRLTRAPRYGGRMTVRNLRGYVFAVFAHCIGGKLDGDVVPHVSDVFMRRLPGDTLPDAVRRGRPSRAGRESCKPLLRVRGRGAGGGRPRYPDPSGFRGWRAAIGSGAARRRGGVAAGRLIEIKAPGRPHP